MHGWIDLHCHWVAGIDDGARSTAEGFEILQRLARLGFGEVIGTPHMRPGLFDNTRADLERAFSEMVAASPEASSATPDVGVRAGLPRLTLSAEHYFDDVVVERILAGDAAPYPGGKAILLEFYDVAFSPALERRLFEIQRRGFTPVIAHPERYRPLWAEPERLERLLDLGAVALLDACAVVGKYGKEVRRCALELLERDAYLAACSDAHRPADVAELERAIGWLEREYGAEELDALFGEGPRKILSGTPYD